MEYPFPSRQRSSFAHAQHFTSGDAQLRGLPDNERVCEPSLGGDVSRL